jgi:hypothetical protein
MILSLSYQTTCLERCPIIYPFTLSLTSLQRELSKSPSARTSQTEFDMVGLIGTTSSHYSQDVSKNTIVDAAIALNSDVSVIAV